jgi:hypothetical protein
LDIRVKKPDYSGKSREVGHCHDNECGSSGFQKLEASSIRVAEYLTDLPPREVPGQKLKVAVEIARERIAARTAE